MKRLYIFFLLILLNCENLSQYEKKETLRNLYIFLNLPDDQKIHTLCKESESSAINCLSSNIAYINLLNTFYNISITSTNPDEYCPVILNSVVFSKFSNDAKRCHFECNHKFWQNVSDCSKTSEILNTYSECLPGIWIKECKDQNFKNCLKNCFQNGTPIWFIK